MTNNEKVVWRYTQFLVNRIQSGDFLILQFDQPLRKFLIAKVTEGYDYEENELEDFNHIIHCKPITTDFVSIDSHYISKSMRHALTKRGQYYEIYPEETIKEINKLVKERIWEKEDFDTRKRTIADEMIESKEALKQKAIQVISTKWPSTEFEYLIEDIIVKESRNGGEE